MIPALPAGRQKQEDEEMMSSGMSALSEKSCGTPCPDCLTARDSRENSIINNQLKVHPDLTKTLTNKSGRGPGRGLSVVHTETNWKFPYLSPAHPPQHMEISTRLILNSDFSSQWETSVRRACSRCM